MGAQIDVVCIVHWEQLQQEAQRTPLYDINPAPFWKSVEVELDFGSAREFDHFRRRCDDMSAVGSPLLERQLITLFDWVDAIEEFDAPFSRFRPRSATDSWEQIAEGLLGAFSPHSVTALCEVARAFSWDKCAPLFEKISDDTLLDFERFCAYGQKWLDHYEEARKMNAGFLAYVWG